MPGCPAIKFLAVDQPGGTPKVITGGIDPPYVDDAPYAAFIRVKGEGLELSLHGLTVRQLEHLQQLAASLADRLKPLVTQQ